LKEVNKLVIKTVEDIQKKGNDGKWSILKHKVKESISKYIYAQTKRRPMILPVIIEV